jgi:hypothetical protein
MTGLGPTKLGRGELGGFAGPQTARARQKLSDEAQRPVFGCFKTKSNYAKKVGFKLKRRSRWI